MSDRKVIGFKADEDLRKLVDERARRTERTRSGMLRYIVTDWFMSHAANKLVDDCIIVTDPGSAATVRDCNKALEQERA